MYSRNVGAQSRAGVLFTTVPSHIKTIQKQRPFGTRVGGDVIESPRSSLVTRGTEDIGSEYGRSPQRDALKVRDVIIKLAELLVVSDPRSQGSQLAKK